MRMKSAISWCSLFFMLVSTAYSQTCPGGHWVIQDITITVGASSFPSGSGWSYFPCIGDGCDAPRGIDLNRGAGGEFIYAWQKVVCSAPGLTVVTDMKVAVGICGSGWIQNPVDLNAGAGGEFIYVCLKKGPSSSANVVSGVLVTNGNNNPYLFGMTSVSFDVNAGAGGDYIFIMWKYNSCPSSCKNNGYCGYNGKCVCTGSYAGNDCSVFLCPKVNGQECNNHGTCNQVTRACSCANGYGGASCTNVNECNKNFCPGATCIDTDGSYYCNQQQLIVPVNCFGDSTGMVRMNFSSASYKSLAPFKARLMKQGVVVRNWERTSEFRDLPAGNYAVEMQPESITSTAPATFNVAVAQPPNRPVVQLVSSKNATCRGDNNGFVQVAGSLGTAGGYTFKFDNRAYTSATGFITNAGTHTVRVLDKNQCAGSNILSVVVSEPGTFPHVSLTKTDVVGISSATGAIYASGINGSHGTPIKYLLESTTPGGNSTEIYSSSGTFTALVSGSYTVYARDAFNCTTSASVTILEPKNYAITAPSTARTGCPVEVSVRARIGTSLDPSYARPVVIESSDAAAPVPTSLAMPSAQGTFEVTFPSAGDVVLSFHDSADPSVFPSASTTISVIQGMQLDGEPTAIPATCHGISDGQASVSVTDAVAPVSYNWTRLDGDPLNPATAESLIPGGITPTISGLAAGFYKVTIQDDACSGANTIVAYATVGQPPAIVNHGVTVTPVTCPNGNNGIASIDITGGNSLRYKWTRVGSPSVVLSESSVVTGLRAGDYQVQVTDEICMATDIVIPVTVAQPPHLTVSRSGSPQTSCNGGQDGTINLSVNNGVTPVVMWNSTSASNSGIMRVMTSGPAPLDGLAAGTYKITIFDLSCSSTRITFSSVIVQAGTATCQVPTPTNSFIPTPISVSVGVLFQQQITARTSNDEDLLFPESSNALWSASTSASSSDLAVAIFIERGRAYLIVDAINSGTYTVDVMYNGIHVTGSPVSVEVL